MPDQHTATGLPGRGEEHQGPGSPPPVPHVVVELRADGTGLVDGVPLSMPEGSDPRDELMTAACLVAARLGRPVPLTAKEPGGAWHLLAHPDGHVSATDEGNAEPPVDDHPTRHRPAGHASSAGRGAVEVDVDAEPPGGLRVASVGPQDAPDDLDRRLASLLRSDVDVDAAAGRFRPGPLGSPADRVLPVSPWIPATPVQHPAVPSRPVTRRSRTAPPFVPASRPGALEHPVPAPRRRANVPLVAAVVGTGVALVFVAVLAVSPGSPRGTSTSAPGVPQVGAALPSPTGVRTVRPSGSTASGSGRSALSDVVAPSHPGPLTGIAVPPGYRSTPTWSLQIASWTRSAATVDGFVVTRTPAGRVVLLGPDDGVTRWVSAESTAAAQDGPWLTGVDGKVAVAVADAGSLTYWVLPDRTTRGPSPSGAPPVGTGIRVALPRGAQVSWVGTGPLVTMPDGSAGVVTSGKVVTVPLPSGARALTVDGTTVLAVTRTSSTRRAAGQGGDVTHALPSPPGATGDAPVRVEAVGERLLASVWRAAGATGQVLALSDSVTGRLLVHTPVASGADLRSAPLLREVGGSQTMIGSVVVDPYSARVDLLAPDYTVRGLNRGHAWAEHHGRSVDIHLNAAGDFTVVPFGAGTPATPIGVVDAVTGRPGLVLVVVPAGDGWALAALPEN